MRCLRESTHGVVDLGVVLMIGIAFAALLVISYIIFVLQDMLVLGTPTGNASTNPTGWANYWAENATRSSVGNVTVGFDNAIALILVAITVFILAIAISALLMLRSR